MQRRRISKNRLEGFKNVKRQPERHCKEKLTFDNWFWNGLERCEFQGAKTYVDKEHKQVFIKWSEEETVIRTIDDMYLEWRDEYCEQWKVY